MLIKFSSFSPQLFLLENTKKPLVFGAKKCKAFLAHKIIDFVVPKKSKKFFREFG